MELDPEIDALFARTLLGEYDGDDPVEAVIELRKRGSREVFELAAAWCVSDNPLKRARGADILCQLRIRYDKPLFKDESYSLITKILVCEQESLVIDSAIHGLSHLGNPTAIPLILAHLNHFDENVRLAVARALGSFPNDPDSIRGLLKLTSDTDEEVRDWAVFGLGVLGDVDSPEIRATLLRCLDDPNVDVREEAAVGLGKRQDPRLLPKLLPMLGELGFSDRVAEASYTLIGLEKDNPEWGAEEYKAALIAKFRTAD